MKTKEELKTELEALVKKHGKGNVYEIETPLSQDDNCETATIFLLKANRTQYSMINTVLRKSNDSLVPIEAALKSCYIGGDELNTVLTNEDALFGCDVPLYAFLQRKSGEIKKN